MKPSSSRSDLAAHELFASVFSRSGVAREVADGAFLRAMLDAEAALARALSRAGVVSPEAARGVTDAARVERFDAAQIGRDAAGAGNPVPALVRALVASVPEDAASAVHFGATSQDIIDTALMLVAKRSLAVIGTDLRATVEACAALADRHRATLMTGRTLLTPALPITFGLKAALWLEALDRVRRRTESTSSALPVQLGGAAGTLAALGERGPAVSRAFAEELDLVEPVVPWHAFRLPILELAGVLAAASAVSGKIARDISLLAQPEIGEVEVGGGGSSTLPQKSNPVGAVAVLACTRRVPGLVATLVAASEQEHERGAGGWHAEWETVADLLRVVGSAAAACRELVEGLCVNGERMRRNLDATRGALLSERVAFLLAPSLGKLEAHDLVRGAALRARDGERSLLDSLLENAGSRAALARAGLDREALERALEPGTYLGSTEVFIDRALAAARRREEP